MNGILNIRESIFSRRFQMLNSTVFVEEPKFSQATCFEDGGTELIWTAIGHGRDCRGGDIPLLHLGQLNKACLVRMITEWLGKRYFLKRFPLLPWADLNGDLLLKNSQ
jgi:hypothetical protein